MGQQGEGEEAKRKKKSPGRILCLPATKVDSQVSSRVQAFSLGEYNVMRMKGEWENGIKKIQGGGGAIRHYISQLAVWARGMWLLQNICQGMEKVALEDMR